MNKSVLTGLLAASWLGACASVTPTEPTAAPQEKTAANAAPLQPASTSPELWASKQSKKDTHVWSVPTDDELRKLDYKYLRASEDFVKLKKDGALMFCKRFRVIGSNIASIQCITEGELRTQVDNMTSYREDMRNRAGKCVAGKGPNGCSGNM
jgi:hypothetical protein